MTDVERLAIALYDRYSQSVGGWRYAPEINSLTVGEVSTDEPGWEKKLDDLVISARARMAELNAFIDSYTGTVS